MRISKTLASGIASYALAHRKTDIEEAHIEYNDIGVKAVESSTASIILEASSKYPEHFNFSKRANLLIRGQDYGTNLSIEMPKEWPREGSRHNSFFIIEANKLKEVEKAWQKVEKLKDALKKDIENLEVTILALRTKKNVIDNIPELEKYFPVELATTTAVAINYDSLRKLLATPEK